MSARPIERAAADRGHAEDDAEHEADADGAGLRARASAARVWRSRGQRGMNSARAEDREGDDEQRHRDDRPAASSSKPSP